MKAPQYILTMALTLLTTVIYGQTVETSDTILVDELKKTWYYMGITLDSLPLYKSTTHAPNNYGLRMEFHYNGDFVQADGTPCFHDRQEPSNGHWSLDEDSLILKIMTYQEEGPTLYKIKKLTTTELVLKKNETPAANNH